VIAKPVPTREPVSLTVRDRWLLWLGIHIACFLIGTVERLPRRADGPSFSASPPSEPGSCSSTYGGRARAHGR
jgi:hypothetical protein